ncbi:MAG TPA: nucleoside deaminase [Steroidobacteraceae bacterium]|nr:nucleoside deaminase [Steroidobacteraceae bacterium]HUA23686.1 nucleoside deaminase [Steroidobacteraceae bacterium]
MLIFDTLDHERYMAAALEEAKLALEAGDLPIGAVIVCDQNIISTGRNRIRTASNQLQHAELSALLKQSPIVYERHDDCVIYTTVEPCVMCLGAIAMADIRHVVFGAADPDRGGTDMYGNVAYVRKEIHRYVGGIREAQCRALIDAYEFRQLAAPREAPGLP